MLGLPTFIARASPLPSAPLIELVHTGSIRPVGVGAATVRSSAYPRSSLRKHSFRGILGSLVLRLATPSNKLVVIVLKVIIVVLIVLVLANDWQIWRLADGLRGRDSA